MATSGAGLLSSGVSIAQLEGERRHDRAINTLQRPVATLIHAAGPAPEVASAAGASTPRAAGLEIAGTVLSSVGEILHFAPDARQQVDNP
jgi:hypothetical protein